MNRRKEVLEQIRKDDEFDVIVIGGGASGIGTALEASLRGYRTLLLEKYDYTKGTSSKSTKLVHGGVRYMAQGDLKMVREALKERGILLKNASHLVHNQSFIIPNYTHWHSILYGIGLKFYDLLSGSYSLGPSRILNQSRVRKEMPGISTNKLKSGVLYHDGQFDDSRLAMDMLHSFTEHGGLALNYFEVNELIKDGNQRIRGVSGRDMEGKENISALARVVINATGVWADDILKLDNSDHEKTIRPSQGIHLVVDKSFLPGPFALMIPKTSDGRVLFAVPWHDHLVIGTTDTPIDENSIEPLALESEVQFILDTASQYLIKPIRKEDILSVFAGLRPLAAPQKGSSKTKEISRNHKVLVSKNGLISIIGGKWTTYRRMGQDLIDTAVRNGQLHPTVSKSKTFHISGKDNGSAREEFLKYGHRASELEQLIRHTPWLEEKVHPSLPYLKAEIMYVSANEMVVHLEDILARRLRALFLDARASIEISGAVAALISEPLGWDEKRTKEETENFKILAKNYILN